METAAAYIRVSSQRQVDEGGSLDSQTKLVHEGAETRGYFLRIVFREEGESAKTDRRPQLQALLKYCAKPENGINVVLIPKIDRLARNVYDYVGLKLQLKRMNIRLESLGETIEDTPAGRFTETIIAGVAQFDNEVRAERSRGGLTEAVELGRWVWKAPFGYRNTRHQGKGTIEPHPEESRIVVQVFERVARHGIDSAQMWVRKQGVKISRSALYRMIGHPIYVGRIRAFGREFEAAYPAVPLVSDQLYARAHAALKRKTRSRTRRDHPDFALRGTLKCSCGKRMTAYYAKGRSDRYGYYRCMQCRHSNYRSEMIHESFVEELNTYQLDNAYLSELKRRLEFDWTQAHADYYDAKKRLEKEIQGLETLRRSMALKNAAGVIPDEVASEQLTAMSDKLTQLRSQVAESREPESPEDLIAFAGRFLSSLGSYWKSGNLQIQKHLLRFIFPNGLEYDPDEGFRTAEYPVLDRLKSDSSSVLSSLVDPTVDGSNRFEEKQFTEKAGVCTDPSQSLELILWVQQMKECQAAFESDDLAVG